MNKDGRGREMKELIEQLGKLTDTRKQWGNLRHKLVDIVLSCKCMGNRESGNNMTVNSRRKNK